jgi:protein-tyrosine phosphatase
MIFSRPAVSVLFVCTANICRSPMAHALLVNLCRARGLHKLVRVDSAGTHVSIRGQRPDPRVLSVLTGHGIKVGRMRARPLLARDLERFDHIFAMDREQLDTLVSLKDQAATANLELVMRFARHHDEQEVPDPYFGNDAGFLKVFTLLADAIEGIFNDLVIRRLDSDGQLPAAGP